MSESLTISVAEWLAPNGGDSFEGATNAELSIVIGDHRVCEVEDFESKTVRKTIRVSAGLAALWFVANWWRLRWEAQPISPNRMNLDWAMSHSMPAIGGGYLWPDLAFTGSDGSQILAVCKRHVLANSEELASIRYLNNFSALVDAATFEDAVSEFVTTVIARLDSFDVRKSQLHDLWNDLSLERRNLKVSFHRKLEALIGLDPDEDDGLIGSLAKWSRAFGQQAIEEISAATNKDQIEAVLGAAKEAIKVTKTFADVPTLTDVIADTPWRRGREAAYALRERWALGSSPIEDSTLADRLNLPMQKLAEVNGKAPFSFGIRGSVDGKMGFVLVRHREDSRRFDVARLIGDCVVFDQDELLRPATGAITSRQKFQRAFAAEFLCPSEMVRSRFEGEDDQTKIGDMVNDLSREYKVSEQVILHHMENRHVLPQGLSKELLLA